MSPEYIDGRCGRDEGTVIVQHNEAERRSTKKLIKEISSPRRSNGGNDGNRETRHAMGFDREDATAMEARFGGPGYAAAVESSVAILWEGITML